MLPNAGFSEGLKFITGIDVAALKQSFTRENLLNALLPPPLAIGLNYLLDKRSQKKNIKPNPGVHTSLDQSIENTPGIEDILDNGFSQLRMALNKIYKQLKDISKNQVVVAEDSSELLEINKEILERTETNQLKERLERYKSSSSSLFNFREILKSKSSKAERSSNLTEEIIPEILGGVVSGALSRGGGLLKRVASGGRSVLGKALGLGKSAAGSVKSGIQLLGATVAGSTLGSKIVPNITAIKPSELKTEIKPSSLKPARIPGQGLGKNVMSAVVPKGGIASTLLGKAAAPLTAGLSAVEAYNVYNNENLTKSEKVDEYSKIGGSLAGTLAGAKLGAAVGAVGGPVGMVIGGLIGSLGGSLLGEKFGDYVGDFLKPDEVKTAVDKSTKDSLMVADGKDIKAVVNKSFDDSLKVSEERFSNTLNETSTRSLKVSEDNLRKIVQAVDLPKPELNPKPMVLEPSLGVVEPGSTKYERLTTLSREIDEVKSKDEATPIIVPVPINNGNKGSSGAAPDNSTTDRMVIPGVRNQKNTIQRLLDRNYLPLMS